MRKRGEITVFLSLTLVCVLSLLMGLLESARVTGARLYLQMAADSAMSSVMSQYNRNLWEMYQLLFLEYQSEEAIENSFEEFLEYYLDQENYYPMQKENVELTELVTMTADGGRPLEEEILSYVKYRLPEAAADLAGILGEAEQAAKAGDFRNILQVCRQAGKETRKLEKRRLAVENALREMEEYKEQALEGICEEDDEAVWENIARLRREMRRFPGLVAEYAKEVRRISEHREEIASEQMDQAADGEAAANMEQELLAYGQVEEAAEQTLEKYREMEVKIADGLEMLEEMEEIEYSEEDGPDWELLQEYVEGVEIPGAETEHFYDKEKAEAVDRLEELLSSGLLELVLPEGTSVSERKVSTRGRPSESMTEGEALERDLAEKLMIGEYVQLYFRSFLKDGAILEEEQALSYEQEYLLCGKAGDQENLAGVAEQLLAIRGAANLCYLLGEPGKKSQADALAASLSAGYAPVQVILSLFILSLWALAEAIVDVRTLFAGEAVPMWKNRNTWRTSLEGILSMEFLSLRGNGNESGSKYEDYLRILLFLQDNQVRNYRMMDLIQWNVRKRQPDFAVAACAYQLNMTAEVRQRHRFLIRSEYTGTVCAAGTY